MPLLIGAAVAGIGGLAMSAYGASQAGKVTKYDQNKIREDLAPWQKSIDKMGVMSQTMAGRAEGMYGQADQFFDPRSDYYNQQRQQMREQISGQTANVAQQQNQLMAQRGMGGGGIKGLLGAVSANQAGEQTRQGMLGMQQQGIGLGQRQQQLAGGVAGQSANLLGQATQQQGAHSENIAQAYLANVDATNAAQQAKAAGYMGMGQGLLGAAGTMAGGYTPTPAPNSDIALKKDIELKGKSPNGLNIYEFKYKDKKHGDGTYIGVMAQDVQKTKYKDAVSRHMEGHLVVNYDKLDVNFERIA